MLATYALLLLPLPQESVASQMPFAVVPKGFAAVTMEDQYIGPPRKVDLPFAFSPDGKRLALIAAKKDRVYGFLDGKPVG